MISSPNQTSITAPPSHFYKFRNTWLSKTTLVFITVLSTVITNKISTAQAPLNGTYSIGGSGTNDMNADDGFASFTGGLGAIDYINKYGTSGPVILEIKSDLQETAHQFELISSTVNHITIRPDGSTMRTIWRDNADKHPIIRFLDCHNITIDGSNPNTGTGRYLTFRHHHHHGDLVELASTSKTKNITLKNCVFETDNLRDEGSVELAPGGDIDSVIVENNLFRPLTANGGSLSVGLSLHQPIGNVVMTGIEIRKNEFVNMPGEAIHFVDAASHQGNIAACLIQGNSFYTTSKTKRAHRGDALINIGFGHGFDIQQNYFGGNAKHIGSGFSEYDLDQENLMNFLFFEKNLKPGQTNRINNNIFAKIMLDGNQSIPSEVHLIYAGGGDFDIGGTNPNYFGSVAVDATFNPSIKFTQNTPNSNFRVIEVNNASNATISNNRIGGISIESGTPTASGSCYIIDASTGSYSCIISDNMVGAQGSPNNIVKTSPGSFGAIRSINTGYGVVTNNKIDALRASNLQSNSFYAIYRGGIASNETKIADNSIGQTNVNATVNPRITIDIKGTGKVFGIYQDGSGTKNNISNNTIGGMAAIGNGTDTTSLYGIYSNYSVAENSKILENKIGGNTRKNIYQSTTGEFVGMYIGGNTQNIQVEQNSVKSVYCAGNFGGAGNATMLRITCNANDQITILKNTIGDTSATSAGLISLPSIELQPSTIGTNLYNAFGICCNASAKNITIERNSIGGIKVGTFNPNSGLDLSGIFLSATTSVKTTIRRNFIGGTAKNIAQQSKGYFRGITIQGTHTNVEVSLNDIKGVYADTYYGEFPTYMIYDNCSIADTMRITNNDIGIRHVNSQVAPSLEFKPVLAAPWCGIFHATGSGKIATIKSNRIGGIRISAANPSAFHNISLIRSASNVTEVVEITNNSLGSNISQNSIYQGTSGSFRGIYSSTSCSNLAINSNKLQSFQLTNYFGNDDADMIYVTGNSSSVSIRHNQIGNSNSDAQSTPSINCVAGTGTPFAHFALTGIRTALSGSKLTIDNNKVGGVYLGTTNTGIIDSDLYGIQAQGNPSETQITYNKIGSSDMSRNILHQTNRFFKGIFSSADNKHEIIGNSVSGITMNGPSSGKFYGIHHNRIVDVNDITISGNTIGKAGVDASVQPNISILNSVSTDSPNAFGILCDRGKNVELTNNKVAGITLESGPNNSIDFSAIRCGYIGNTISARVNNNTIGDPTVSNSINKNASGSNYGIRLGSSQVNNAEVNGNVIQNIHHTNVFDSYFRGIYTQTSGTASVTHNRIANISGNTISDLAEFSGIYSASASTVSIVENQIENWNMISSQTTSGNYILGIYSETNSEGQIISNNIIDNLAITATGGKSTHLRGVYLNNSSNGGALSKNSITRLHTNTNASSSDVTGVYIRNGSWCVSNNTISLDNNSNPCDVDLAGIYDRTDGSESNHYNHNTIKLSGTGTKWNRSYCFYHGNYPGSVYLRNNILTNQKSSSTSNHHAIRNAAGGNCIWNSDYNLMFTTNSNELGRWGTADASFANFQTASGGDAHSFVANVNLVSTGMPKNDADWLLVDNNGADLSSSTCPVSEDIQQGGRTTGNPDIGAYEHAKIWTANASTSDWFTATNWKPIGVPTNSDNIVIPTIPEGGIIFPNINNTGAIGNGIFIHVSASITMSNNSTLDIGGDLNVDGVFTSFSNDETVNIKGRCKISGTGNIYVNHLNIEPTAYLTLPPSKTLNISGNWNNTGKFSAASSSLINFNGPDNQYVENPNGETFNQMKVSKTGGTVHLQTDLNIENSLNFQSGDLRDNGNSLHGQGSLTMIGGNLFFAEIDAPVPGLQGAYAINGGNVNLIAANGQQILNNKIYQNLFIDNTFGTYPQVILTPDHATVNGDLHLTNGIVLGSESGMLKLGANATATGASMVSHVNGPMSKSGNSDFEFPVGYNGYWAPIKVSNLSKSTDFTAEYWFENHHDASLNSTSGLMKRSFKEFWNLTPTSSAEATIDLYWKDNAESYITECGDLVMAKYDETNGEWISLNKDACSFGIQGKLTKTNVQQFGDFTFGSLTLNPLVNSLPVELLLFSAVAENDHVNLYWATASEHNSDYYEIERSADGQNFHPIGITNAIGNSSTRIDYLLTDHSPFSRLSYYRLKMVDLDGKFSYSEIKAVSFSSEAEPVFVIYPNPAKIGGDLSFYLHNFPTETPIKFSIHDVSGRLILESKITLEKNRGNSSLQLNTIPAAGVYIVSVRIDDTRGINNANPITQITQMITQKLIIE